MRTLLRILVAVPVLLATLWWALALYFAAPGPAMLQVALASPFALGTVGLLIWLRPFLLALGVWAVALAIILFWWSTLRPSNDRDWQPDVARLASAEVQGNRLIVHNLRNADYLTETDYTVRYEERAYELSKLRGLDLFMIYWDSPSIAHTILSWQFDGSPPLAISIETRKQNGEEYSTVGGFFKQYEIIYVVADERDVIRLRTNYRNDGAGEEVYLYRLKTPIPQARALVLDANPNAPPFDWRFIANGYGDELMYERGNVETRIPFAELKARSRVNAKAKAADRDPLFSLRIRDGVPDPRILW